MVYFTHRPVLSQVKQKTPIILPGFELVGVPDGLSGQSLVRGIRMQFIALLLALLPFSPCFILWSEWKFPAGDQAQWVTGFLCGKERLQPGRSWDKWQEHYKNLQFCFCKSSDAGILPFRKLYLFDCNSQCRACTFDICVNTGAF